MTSNKKRTRKPKTVAARSFEQVAIEEFAKTGELTGLGALADHCDETDRAEFAETLRAVARGAFDGANGLAVRASAVQFFMGNGLREVCSRFLQAVELAEAEAWFKANQGDDWNPLEGSFRFLWEVDSYYEDGEEQQTLAWSCLLQRCEVDGDDTDWNTVESLSGITFGGDGYPSGDPYKRLVEAELAQQWLG